MRIERRLIEVGGRGGMEKEGTPSFASFVYLEYRSKDWNALHTQAVYSTWDCTLSRGFHATGILLIVIMP